MEMAARASSVCVPPAGQEVTGGDDAAIGTAADPPQDELVQATHHLYKHRARYGWLSYRDG